MRAGLVGAMKKGALELRAGLVGTGRALPTFASPTCSAVVGDASTTRESTVLQRCRMGCIKTIFRAKREKFHAISVNRAHVTHEGNTAARKFVNPRNFVRHVSLRGARYTRYQ